MWEELQFARDRCQMRILQNLGENSEGCTTSETWGTREECIMSARP